MGAGPIICGINEKIPVLAGVPLPLSTTYCGPVVVKFPV
jgi:hypothetical protein